MAVSSEIPANARSLGAGAAGRKAGPQGATTIAVRVAENGRSGTPFSAVRPTSGFGLHLQHLATLVHAGLEVDMVRTAQFA